MCHFNLFMKMPLDTVYFIYKMCHHLLPSAMDRPWTSCTPMDQGLFLTHLDTILAEIKAKMFLFKCPLIISNKIKDLFSFLSRLNLRKTKCKVSFSSKSIYKKPSILSI